MNMKHIPIGKLMSFLFWVCVVVGIFGVCFAWYVWHFKDAFGLLLGSFSSIACLFVCATAIVLTIVEGFFKGSKKRFWRAGTIRLLLVLVISAPMVAYLTHYRPYYDESLCQAKLRNLSAALVDYRQSNGGYPSAEVWCDEILEFVSKNPFRYVKGFRHNLTCPTVSNNQASYAINPNANPSSDWQTVLIFECKEGWNRFGGPEIASFENHNGKCFVLLVNGQIISANKETIVEFKW